MGLFRVRTSGALWACGVLMSLATWPGRAEESACPRPAQDRKPAMRLIPLDLGRMYGSTPPFRLREDWLSVAAIGVSLNDDEHYYARIRSAVGSGLVADTASASSRLANGGVALGLCALLYQREDPTLKHASLRAAEAVLYAGIDSQVLKAAFARRRPGEGAGAEFVWFSSQHSSFPSGHAATAFAAAGVFGQYYPRRKIVLYTIASLAALGRVVDGRHWPGDVIAGAGLGALAARQALRLDRVEDPERALVLAPTGLLYEVTF